MTTLAQLRLQFFQRYDAAQNGYIQAPEANQLLNEAARHLHNWFLVEGEFYIWKETTVPLVAGQSDYTLPVDLMKVLKVYQRSPVTVIGQQPMLPMKRLMPEEYRGVITSSTPFSVPYGYFGAYMMLGQILRVIPSPPTTNPGSLLLWYAPVYTDMVADTDQTEACVFPGCEEFIVNRAVIGARIKEESDTSSLEKRQAETVALIQQAMINRDMGKRARVVETSENPRYF
jgi:hypothetical protein